MRSTPCATRRTPSVCPSPAAAPTPSCAGRSGPSLDTPRFQYLAEMYKATWRGSSPSSASTSTWASRAGRAIRRHAGFRPTSRTSSRSSASSPYCEGVDTLFSCCRLNAVNSFSRRPATCPRTSRTGTAVRGPSGAAAYAGPGGKHQGPRIGTSVRSRNSAPWKFACCDTPLTVERACQLAAFAQALAVLAARASPEAWLWLAYPQQPLPGLPFRSAGQLRHRRGQARA